MVVDACIKVRRFIGLALRNLNAIEFANGSPIVHRLKRDVARTRNPFLVQ